MHHLDKQIVKIHCLYTVLLPRQWFHPDDPGYTG